MTDPIPCPWCRTREHVYPHGQREFFCGRCKRLFDADPDEGGDYSDDPSRRAERQERQSRRPSSFSRRR